MSAADHDSYERVDVEAVHFTVLVHVGFGLGRAVKQHFDKRVDIESIHCAVDRECRRA